MPALVNSSVGSLPGTSEEDGTIVWPRSAKNCRKARRTCVALRYGGWFVMLRRWHPGLRGYDRGKSPAIAKSAFVAPVPGARWEAQLRSVAGARVERAHP